MKVIPKEREGIKIFEIHGEIDAEHAAALKKALQPVKQEDKQKVILDLAQVHFIDSTGLGILISLMRHLKEQEGQLVLCGLSSEVSSIFEMTRLFRVFDVSSNLEQALKKFS